MGTDPFFCANCDVTFECFKKLLNRILNFDPLNLKAFVFQTPFKVTLALIFKMTLVKLISFQTVLSNRAKSFESCVFLSRTLLGANSSILEYAFVNSEFDMRR